MALTPTPAARTGGMRVGFVAELVLALALALPGCSAPPSFGGGTEGETHTVVCDGPLHVASTGSGITRV